MKIIEKMNFCQYEEAVVKYHNTLDIKGMPIQAWPFHFDFINSLKSVFDDANKLFQLSVAYKWNQKDWDFESKLKEEVVIVTDSKLRIVFASNNIVKMNGYNREEVMGQSPKMFHGEKTDIEVSNEIRLAIENKMPFEKQVLNYKKNGDTYQCLIKGYPVFNIKGDVSHFIAFEKVA